jgi:hypothetical protein
VIVVMAPAHKANRLGPFSQNPLAS